MIEVQWYGPPGLVIDRFEQATKASWEWIGEDEHVVLRNDDNQMIASMPRRKVTVVAVCYEDHDEYPK